MATAKEMDEMQEKLKGIHPQGKLDPTDEGSLIVGFAIFDGKVVMRFPHAVSWAAMLPEEAEAFAQELQRKAKEAREQENT